KALVGLAIKAGSGRANPATLTRLLEQRLAVLRADEGLVTEKVPMTDPNWFDDYIAETDDDYDIDEYSLTTEPNDFNVLTINSFIESGAVKIPAFQRNYVWDIKRASKLIESLILGLPVPQVFLYEKEQNNYLVI